MVDVVLADSMAGVRDAWRWLLAEAADLSPAAEAGSITEALAAPGDVVLAGLRFPDGSVAELVAADPRPVVVWTFLPADERGDVELDGAAEVIEAGRLRSRLAAALRQAAAAPSSTGTPP